VVFSRIEDDQGGIGVELSDIKSNFLFSKRLYKLLNEERV
jgi:hypothetical protein